MKNFIKIVVFGVFLTIAIAFSWATMTNSGLVWIINHTASKYSNVIHYNGINGTIFSKISAKKIIFNDNNTKIVFNNMDIKLSLTNILYGTLNIPSLSIDSIEVEQLSSENNKGLKSVSETKENIIFDYALPIRIHIDKVNVNSINSKLPVSNIPSVSKLKIVNISISNNINIENLSVNSSIGTFSINGELPLSSSSPLKLNITGNIDTRTVNNPIVGSLTASGTYDNLLISCSIKSPDAITLTGKITNLTSYPNWDLNINTPSLRVDNWHSDNSSIISDAVLHTKGTLENYLLNATGKIKIQGSDAIAFDLSSNKNNSKWKIDNLVLSNKEHDLSVAIDGTINTDYVFDNNTSMSLSAKWQNVIWPISTKSFYFGSKKGDISYRGSLNNYNVAINGFLNVQNHSIDNIHLSGSGNISSVQFNELKCDYLTGVWRGTGGLDWSRGISWKANANVRNVNFNELESKIDTSLSGKVTNSGSYIDNQLQLNSTVSNLQGSINNHKITGHGNIIYKDNILNVRKLYLHSDDNTLKGNFKYNTNGDTSFPVIEANWDVNARKLSSLYKGLQGNILSQGDFLLREGKPVVKGNLSATSVKYGSYSANNIKVKVDLKSHDLNSMISASTNGVMINQYGIKTMNLTIDGTYQKHHIKISGISNKGQNLLMKGTASYVPVKWKINLTDILLKDTDIGSWMQASNSEIMLSKDGFIIQNFCLTATDNNDKVCVHSQSDNYKSINFNVKTDHLSIDKFKVIFPQNIQKVTGYLIGYSDIKYKNNRIYINDINVNSPEGSISVSDGLKKPRSLSYKKLAVTLTKQEQDSTIDAQVNIVDVGNIKTNIFISNLGHTTTRLEENKIAGYLDVRLNNLEKLSQVLPVIDNANGTWTSHFKITGTLSNPIFIGESVIKLSSVSIPVAGIELKDLNLITKTTDSGGLSLHGDAKSGKGSINVEGTLDKINLENFTGNLKITGDHFKIADLPETMAVVSPNLTFTVTEKQASLDGNLTIDNADIKILSQVSSMSPSPDVVLLNQPQASKLEKLSFVSNIQVKLADKVWLRGFGFEGRLIGSLHVRQSPNELTKASGVINIMDGKYSAYGQNLDIEKGTLNYAASPIDNPTVDIRATRKTSNDVVAGLQITGQAQSPSIKLYSDPVMDDSDILAYIILGYPLKEASDKDGALLTRAAGSIGLLGGEKLVKRYAKYFGIDEVKVQSSNTTQEASLVLGKYLSPQLYMSYALGFGQAINTLQIQYKLSEHWVLKTESGVGQAADILFTIEK